MHRFIFEPATPEDNQELLEILEAGAFQGNISLCYTRRPDAYQSLKHEGQQVDIVVCRDLKAFKIVGFGACALRQLFVNGIPENVGYLFNLRVRPEYIKRYPVLHRGYKFLHALHQQHPLSFYITTILAENTYVQKLLEKKRDFMPTYQPVGLYEIFAVKTSKKNVPHASPLAPTSFRKACRSDLPALIQFLTKHGRQYQFFPVLTEDQLIEGNGITIDDFYLLCDQHDEILAAGAVWDQRGYKQYLVKGYGGLFKFLYPFSRFFPLFGFPALPKPGSFLQFFTLSFWAIKDHDPELCHHFLDHLAAISANYPFFLVGLLETHPLHRVMQKRPHISYKSKLYLVYWNEQKEYVDKLDSNLMPYLECGML